MASKIKLGDSVMDVLIKMSEGNPGAANVLAQILDKKDWYAGVDGIMMILNLDTIGIYGSKIWILYKDCCNSDLTQMELVLRNWQMGKLTAYDIQTNLDIPRAVPFENLVSLAELFTFKEERGVI
jgi:hypothetical protein